MSENQSNPPPTAAPAKGPPNILLFAILGLMVVVLGAVVMLFLQMKNHPPAAAAPAAEGAKAEGGEGKEGASQSHVVPGAGPTVRLADFVVKLRNPETDRYARISFELEVGNDKDKETLTLHSAQIRDAFLSFLSDRTVEELRGSTGLATIKQQLLDLTNKLAADAHVRAIFITDFVVQ